MGVDIEPLLKKMDELAPQFGRAQEDLKTLVSRGRAQDYKGVMQNARLVLEALLRSLVTEELKQTPGKAMLDELVTKFRQQANAGIMLSVKCRLIGKVLFHKFDCNCFPSFFSIAVCPYTNYIMSWARNSCRNRLHCFKAGRIVGLEQF